MERPRRRGARKPQSHHHPYGNNVVWRGGRWGIATATGAATGPPPPPPPALAVGRDGTETCHRHRRRRRRRNFSLFFWERYVGSACCPESIIPPRPTQSGSSVSWEVLAPSDRLHRRFGRRFGPGLSPPPCVRGNAKRLIFCVYAVSDDDSFSTRACRTPQAARRFFYPASLPGPAPR